MPTLLSKCNSDASVLTMIEPRISGDGEGLPALRCRPPCKRPTALQMQAIGEVAQRGQVVGRGEVIDERQGGGHSAREGLV